MAQNEIEQLKKKINDLNKRVAQQNLILFSYIHAILGILDDKNLTNSKEFQEYLAKYKKDLAKKIQDVEFHRMMERQFKDKKKGKDDKGKSKD